MAGIPEDVVLYCARHRFSTDAMEATGNLLAVMDVMGHRSIDSTRIYTRTNASLIREVIERRNQFSATGEQGLVAGKKAFLNGDNVGSKGKELGCSLDPKTSD